MTSLLVAIGAVVVGTLASAIAARIISKRIEAAINTSWEDFSAEELREILEELGENLSDNESITMVVTGGRAYWIDDNGLMYAPVDEDDQVDFDQAMQYNAIEAPKEELRTILSILDAIKENT